MNCRFFVGQRVTMKRDHQWGSFEGLDVSGISHPKFGQVYTVAGFHVIGGFVGLYFRELPIPQLEGRGGGWNHERFRPVEERGTESGMEVLRGIRDGKSPKGFEEPRVRVREKA